ncbi:MAG: hypothetical protein KAH01_05320 [Caldisericia bacterium]|nr:hypothetical protein [Caldisericia bacterium]
MLNEFTLAYRDDEKIKNVFGDYNGTQLLKNAKRIFGGKEQVFFEYGRDESAPIFADAVNPNVNETSKNVILKVNQHVESPSGLTAISMTGEGIDTGTSRYDVEYANQYCRPILLGHFKTYETKKYYSIDLSYILAISRSFTDLNFENFEGEGLRILKAWLFVMTYGSHHPEEHELIMVRSSKNEYGESARNRAVVRNSYYKKGEDFNKMGAPYGESRDDEWALSSDDYAKVAALDSIFTQLSLGTPLLYNGSIVPDLIRNSRQYGSTVPEYFNDILTAKNHLKI